MGHIFFTPPPFLVVDGNSVLLRQRHAASFCAGFSSSWNIRQWAWCLKATVHWNISGFLFLGHKSRPFMDVLLISSGRYFPTPPCNHICVIILHNPRAYAEVGSYKGASKEGRDFHSDIIIHGALLCLVFYSMQIPYQVLKIFMP